MERHCETPNNFIRIKVIFLSIYMGFKQAEALAQSWQRESILATKKLLVMSNNYSHPLSIILSAQFSSSCFEKHKLW